jgi:hypothetical protein
MWQRSCFILLGMEATVLEELEVRAIEVARRILPHEPAKSRLLHDLQELCVVLMQEIDSTKKTEYEKDYVDGAISYTDLLLDHAA